MAETLKSMIAVAAYIETANFSDSLLSKNKTSDAMMTIGVAPKWNHPRSFGTTVWFIWQPYALSMRPVHATCIFWGARGDHREGESGVTLLTSNPIYPRIERGHWKNHHKSENLMRCFPPNWCILLYVVDRRGSSRTPYGQWFQGSNDPWIWSSWRNK